MKIHGGGVSKEFAAKWRGQCVALFETV